jgi:hypothetical protein
METFRLLYNKTNVIILAIVAIPIVSVGLLFACLFNLPRNSPDWLVIGIICVYLVLLVLGVLYGINKKASIPCKVTVNEKGVGFEFEKSSFLYKIDKFFSGWENITNISENFYDGEANFYRITFNNPSFTANFSAIKGEEAGAEKFYSELAYYQELYNLNHQEAPIRSKNFYETIWARLITWLFYSMAILVIAMYFLSPKAFEWYRTISLFCFGSIWIGNYYKNTKKLY